MENVKGMAGKMPAGGPAAGRLARVLLLGGAAVYGLTNCLFNVEGGHRWVLGAGTGRHFHPHACVQSHVAAWPRLCAHALRADPADPAARPPSIPAPRRAIVFNRLGGIKEEVYEEGTHVMLPWFERPIIFDVRAVLAGRAAWAGARGRGGTRLLQGRRDGMWAGGTGTRPVRAVP